MQRPSLLMNSRRQIFNGHIPWWSNSTTKLQVCHPTSTHALSSAQVAFKVCHLKILAQAGTILFLLFLTSTSLNTCPRWSKPILFNTDLSSSLWSICESRMEASSRWTNSQFCCWWTGMNLPEPVTLLSSYCVYVLWSCLFRFEVIMNYNQLKSWLVVMDSLLLEVLL